MRPTVSAGQAPAGLGLRAPAAEPAPVRWGVLGAADIAVQKVIPALAASATSTVVAIASRDAGKARAAADKLGIERSYEGYEALLADPAVDAIYNPLPNHLHAPWTRRAAEAGKHVLCEKPIALTAAEARELIAVRDRCGVQIAEAFMVRTHPQWLKVRELVQDGRIGDLQLVVGHFSYFRRDPLDVRSRREYGGGVLLDIGCYPVTLSRWLFGAEPLDVTAILENDPDYGVDRLASGQLRFPGGRLASFTIAGQAVPFQRMQLLGSRGRIEVKVPFNAPPDRATQIVVDDGRDLEGGGAETMLMPAVDQYRLQAERFVDAIRGLGPVPVSLEDAAQNMAVLDALRRSAVYGQRERP